jgi:hypothetical protein
MKFVAEVARLNFQCCQLFPRQSGQTSKNILALRKKIRPLVKITFLNHFIVKICENSSLIHKGKVKGTTLFQNSAPFLLFWYNPSLIRPMICPAAHFFTRTLLSYAAEHSASWQH